MVICSDHRLLWWDSYNDVDRALTSDESKLHKIIIIIITFDGYITHLSHLYERAHFAWINSSTFLLFLIGSRVITGVPWLLFLQPWLDVHYPALFIATNLLWAIVENGLNWHLFFSSLQITFDFVNQKTFFSSLLLVPF